MKNTDVKSVITISLVMTMILITVALIVAVIFGVVASDNPLVNAVVLLFSNSTTMVMTYFFTKRKEGDNESKRND